MEQKAAELEPEIASVLTFEHQNKKLKRKTGLQNKPKRAPKNEATN